MIVTGYSGFDGWLDSIKSIAASVAPSHTVVGKWASGDTQGAASGLGREIRNFLSPRATPLAPSGEPLTAPPPSLIPGVSDMVLVGVAALGAGAFFMLRKRGGKGRRRR